MKIVTVEIDKLKPFERNPKKHPEAQLKKLEKSISEFGWTNPILATKDGMVVAGHDLLEANKERCQYGVTLVFASDAESLQREPGAAPTSERIETLKKAHELGIKTWVSFEPVYYAADAHKLIEQTAEFVDLFKVGKLNYRPEAKDVNWSQFAHDVNDQLDEIGVDYYIKDDLRKFL